MKLHEDLYKEHPGWLPGADARLNLVAKPINLILTAIVNLRVTQHVAGHPQFWSQAISPHLHTEELIAAPFFELQTFYRFGFFQFLMSSIEHGFRCMQPIIVHGVDQQADQAFWKIYTSLFNSAVSAEKAEKHIALFGFLGALRNTIHNNGVYFPTNHIDAQYEISGKEYQLRDGHLADYFGWDHFIEWLIPIHEAIRDLLFSRNISQIPYIRDMASFRV